MHHLYQLNKLFFFSLFVFVFSFSFGTPLNEALTSDTIPNPQKVRTDPKLRMSAQIGYGYRFADFSSEDEPNINKNLKKLKNNLSFGADLSYYFTEYLGVGIKYNGIVAHIETELIGTHYFGALLSAHFFPVPLKHCIFVDAGVGYVRNSDYTKLYGDNTKHVIKNGAAFFAEIGYDFFITKHFAIGVQTSVLIELKKVLIIDPENTSHINVSLGFRFYN